MTCEDCILLLDQYQSRELDEKFRGLVSLHLDNCQDCREETRLLELESAFFQKIDARLESGFPNQWEAMHQRLVEESLIQTDKLPEGKKTENNSQTSVTVAFFNWFEKLALPANTAIICGLFFIVLGITTAFLLINKDSSGEKKLSASGENKKISQTESTGNLPPDSNFQPQKSDVTKEIKLDKKSDSVISSSPKPHSASSKKPLLLAKNEKIKQSKLQAKLPESINGKTKESVAAILATENINSDSPQLADDKKLASYLNKVHLFLLMMRNIKNTESIDTVLGDSYQSEAQAFLKNNNSYKNELLKTKNIPAVELLNEIEPVLQAIANLNKRSEKSSISSMMTIVEQTGIVFKMRLWMANTNSTKVKSI